MEGNEEKKSFFNVIGMSDSFREFDAICKPVIAKGMSPDAVDKDKVAFVNISMKLWELRFQLAQAQQLTVISESLKRILKLVVKEP